MSNPETEIRTFAPNYLVNLQRPPVSMEQAYSNPQKLKKEYTYVKGPESHLLRRKMILRDHPQISTLLKDADDQTYTILLGLVVSCLNILFGYYLMDKPLWFVLLNAYLFGAVINHTLQICIHDLTHHPTSINKIWAILFNIPSGIPSAMSFGRYHADHHNFLNQQDKDTDLPLAFESKWSLQHWWYKYVYYAFLYVYYTLRPIFFVGNMTMGKDEIFNFIFIFFTDYLMYRYFGLYALIYAVFAGLNAVGPHPIAAHMISEHCEFIEGVQTNDYIGWVNYISLNSGYHVEHHDFPTCPWWLLPKVRKMAPEYYEYLPCHTSYFKVLKTFLFKENYNLYNRTIRVPEKVKQ